MSEASDNLEARLSRLRLRPISAGLEQRIETRLGEDATGKSTYPCHSELGGTEMGESGGARYPALANVRALRPSDRWLWSAISSGAIAACVIVAVLVSDVHSGLHTAPLPVEPHMGTTNLSGPALASAAQSWGDELGQALNGSQP